MMTLDRIIKRNKLTIIRLKQTLKDQGYTVKPSKYNDCISLKLNGDDLIEIDMHDTSEPLFKFSLFVKNAIFVILMGIPEDRLIPVKDEMIALYKVGFKQHELRNGKDTWAAWIVE